MIAAVAEPLFALALRAELQMLARCGVQVQVLPLRRVDGGPSLNLRTAKIFAPGAVWTGASTGRRSLSLRCVEREREPSFFFWSSSAPEVCFFFQGHPACDPTRRY